MEKQRKQEPTSPKKDITDDKAEICENCGYVYRINLLEEGEEYNDFGQRYCPYCGRLTTIW